jgi:hypothetical protein
LPKLTTLPCSIFPITVLLQIVFSIATFANIVAYVQGVCVDDYYYYYFALDDGECETYWTYMEYLATWLSVLTAVYLLWSSASASSRAWLAGCMFVIILTQSIKASTYYNTNAMAGINSNLDANIALLWVLFSLWGATLVVNVYREE